MTHPQGPSPQPGGRQQPVHPASEAPAIDTHLSAALSALRVDDPEVPDCVRQTILTHAHLQARRIAETPSNPRANPQTGVPRRAAEASWRRWLRHWATGPAFAAAVVCTASVWVVGHWLVPKESWNDAAPQSADAAATLSTQAPTVALAIAAADATRQERAHSPGTDRAGAGERPGNPTARIPQDALRHESARARAATPTPAPGEPPAALAPAAPGYAEDKPQVAPAEAVRPSVADSAADADTGFNKASAAATAAPTAAPVASASEAVVAGALPPVAAMTAPVRTLAGRASARPDPATAIAPPLQRVIQSASSEALRAALQSLDAQTQGQWRSVAMPPPEKPTQMSLQSTVSAKGVRVADGPDFLLVDIQSDKVRICASRETRCWDAPLKPLEGTPGDAGRERLKPLLGPAQ